MACFLDGRPTITRTCYADVPLPHHDDGTSDCDQEQMLDYDRKITSFEPYSYNNAYNGGGHGMHRGTRWSKTDWRDVVLPAFPYSHHYTQGMSYLLRGLDPDQQYEARVQSR